MPVKRGRSGSMSSCVKSPISLAGPAKVVKIDAVSGPSLPVFMDVASPAKIGEPGGVRIGRFLERCHSCKKRIDQNSDVFMYGGLRAFCSPECRCYQITLDQSAMKKQ